MNTIMEFQKIKRWHSAIEIKESFMEEVVFQLVFKIV